MPPPIILLEFNELSPALVEYFIDQGHLPNFRRLRGQSHAYLTSAQEDLPELDPWVQWVSIHSGVPYRTHGIQHLDEGDKLHLPQIWDLASKSGLTVWVCGSMNAGYETPINGYVLPDPWTTKFPPYPNSLIPFFRFVQQNVLEYTNKLIPLDKADYVRFVMFMLQHGLSLRTVAAIIRQLASERTGRIRWKRVALLDRLQLDLFRWGFRTLKPQFSTFFLNSTAHLQHVYWRNMEPELFKIPPKTEDQQELQTAILFGYKQMDQLIKEIMDFAGPTAILIFCTGLSQQPCLIYEDQGGKTYYRPEDYEKLLAFAGVTLPHKVAPVMSEQFHIDCQSEADAIQIEGQLRALRVDGREVLELQRNGCAIFGGCQFYDVLAEDSIIESSERKARFFDFYYQVEILKSGMHHPDGILWIRYPDSAPRMSKEKVPITEIAPTILEMLSIPQPAHMAGRSLLNRAP